MNFFAHQDQARRQTRKMLLLFALAVVAVVLAIDLVLTVALGSHARHGMSPACLFVINLLIVIVIGCSSLYRIATLRGGGAEVARQLDGVPVPTHTGNFA